MVTVERLQATSLRLADRTGAAVAALYGSSDFDTLAAALVVRANVRAAQLADLALVAEYRRQLRQAVAPLGLAPDELQIDEDRILAALTATLDDDPIDLTDDAELAASRRARLTQVARAEPLVTVSTAMHAAMSERKVPGWVRLPDSNPCPACSRWADGVVRPSTVRMARHRGCACIQQPVLAG